MQIRQHFELVEPYRFIDLVDRCIDRADLEPTPLAPKVGIPRLIEGLRRGRDLPPQSLLAEIVNDVQHFSGPEQYDDITLMIDVTGILPIIFHTAHDAAVSCPRG